MDNATEQLFYWRCAFSLFASSEEVHPNNPFLRNMLFVNKMPPEYIDGISVPAMVRNTRLELVPMEITTDIPPDYYHAVTTQFYLVDLFEQLVSMLKKGNFTENDIFLVLDSDCLFNHPISKEFINDIETYKAVSYTNGDSDLCEGAKIYDLTLGDMKELFKEYAGEPCKTFRIAGGEFFAIHASVLEEFAKEARAALEICFARHKAGLQKYNTEEMLFGYVLTKMNFPPMIGNRYIRRIYTSPEFNTQAEDDKDIMIWHLLTEKRGAFVHYFINKFYHLALPPEEPAA